MKDTKNTKEKKQVKNEREDFSGLVSKTIEKRLNPNFEKVKETSGRRPQSGKGI